MLKQDLARLRKSLSAPKNQTNKLRSWFLAKKRNLPWRQNPSPYAVWVSEVMLQQTQVSVVIPYFLRWMERFPTISHLAQAPLEEVIKLWEGLGYYSRARNLHTAAKSLPNGKLNPDTLLKVKGIGPYTRGAILSFAFHQKAAAVDGNVRRVMSRYYALDDLTEVQTLVEDFLPDERPWEVMEALIELGATVCKRTPTCSTCPLASTCRAKAYNLQSTLPIQKPRVKTTYLERHVAIIRSQNCYLLYQNPPGQVMAGLYEFPYFEKQTGSIVDLVRKHLSLDVQLQSALAEVTHTFTRYKATLFPWLLTIKTPSKVSNYSWHSIDVIDRLPFSSGHRKLKELIIKDL